MAGLAFVFSGQGDQKPGMGKDSYERSEAAAQVFDTCEELRPGTKEQCFAGPSDILNRTENAQPCLFAMELAQAAELREHGVEPDAVAGFSLGEMSAATFAGVFGLEDGFALVCARGALMQRAADAADTFMAAVVKLDEAGVREVCAQFEDVYPVNFNCPGQTTVAGLASRKDEFVERVRAAGGRAIPLKVSGAFHSPFMKEAARDFAEELANRPANLPTTKLYSNVTAEPYGDNPRDLLARQICSPVKWEREVRAMVAAGIDTFVEVGPGNTLTNMIRRISDEVRACGADEYLEGLR